jgi:hypothetical protein
MGAAARRQRQLMCAIAYGTDEVLEWLDENEVNMETVDVNVIPEIRSVSGTPALLERHQPWTIDDK